jgi:hypothetical protein
MAALFSEHILTSRSALVDWGSKINSMFVTHIQNVMHAQYYSLSCYDDTLMYILVHV